MKTNFQSYLLQHRWLYYFVFTVWFVLLQIVINPVISYLFSEPAVYDLSQFITDCCVGFITSVLFYSIAIKKNKIN